MAITDNLVASYPLSEVGTPASWGDVTGGGSDLTNFGGSQTIGVCEDDFAAFFNASELDYADIANPPALAFAGTFAWTCFFKAHPVHNQLGPIFNKGLDFPAALDYALFFNSEPDSEVGTLVWSVRSADNAETGSVTWATPLVKDAWYFVSVYHKDGVEIGLSVGNAAFQTTPWTNGVRVTTGRFIIGGTNVGSFHYTGAIAHLQAWDGRLLTSAEQNFLAGIFPPSACAPQYPFEEFEECGVLSRALSAEFLAYLEGTALALAVCVKLTREDSTVSGYTSHDRDILFEGVTYEALSSVEATALRQELGGGIDNLDVVGLLQSDAISESDLRAGLYDGATVVLFLVNWEDLTMGSLILLAGTLGDIKVSDGKYIAEIRSKMQRMAQQVGELTSPTCRVKELGDARCKVNLASFQFSKTVSAVVDRRNFTFASDAAASGFYDYGKVEFTSGANAGLKKEIKTHINTAGAAVIKAQEAFPYDVQIGDVATLTAGCDRRFSSCKDKFNNLVNMRAEPHVPGTTKIMTRGRQPTA